MICLLFVAVAAAAISAVKPRFPFGLADYDWAFHLIAFFVITLIGAAIAWRPWKLLVLGGLLGVAIEAAQAMVPTRSASLDDVLLNVLGITAGLLCFAGLRWLMKIRPAARPRQDSTDARLAKAERP